MRQALDQAVARRRAATAAGGPLRSTTAGRALGAGTPRATQVERARRGSEVEPPPPTRLATAITDGRFVISVEIDPPRSVRIERTIEAARLLQEAGVDLVNISDSAMARVRMGAMAVAFGIQHDLDLECLVHFTTRDRNLMAHRVRAARRPRAGRSQHPGADRRSATHRRLPVGNRHLGHRFDRSRRRPGAPQPRRGPGRQADRRAGRFHHRLRARSDRRRHRSTSSIASRESSRRAPT